MVELPEFWRTEVWHPLSVHFPIALLISAFFFKLIALFKSREVWNLGGSILLYAGTVSAWIAIYTGDLADGIVSRTICDPRVLNDHENAAYIVGWIFTAATVADVLPWITKSLKKEVLKWLVIITLAVGTGFLVYVGHLGATLVYQQGAGVYKPTSDCREYL